MATHLTTIKLNKIGSLTWAFWLISIAIALLIEIAAALSGGDASWDLRNYHIYNPFALLNKPFGTDIAPAHMQTFFSPTLDLLYYGLARSIHWTPLLNLLLALPQAVAAVFALTLSWRLVCPRNVFEAVALGLLTVMAVTGTAAFTTIAMSVSEMLPAVLVMGALLVLIRSDLEALPSRGQVLRAGLLVGVACGLKLTMSFATISLAIAILLIPRRQLSDLITRQIWFGLGVLIGALTLSGYWWVLQYLHYGNPLFPLANNVFRSPDALPDSFIDRTFLPRSFGDALMAPWDWALRLSWATNESRVRDPRFSLGVVAAIFCLVRTTLSQPRWAPWPVVVLPFWFLLAFILWRVEFSIHRYLSVIELLIGAVVALAAIPLARQFRKPGLIFAGSAGLLAFCFVVTVYPRLYRTPAGSSPPFQVDLGPIPPSSMVLLLDNEPMAYLAAFADPHVRFIGTNDFFMTLDSVNPLQPAVERAIAAHTGPLFGLDSPTEYGTRGDQTLARYGLSRGACRTVPTNLSPNPIRICTLTRLQQVH